VLLANTNKLRESSQQSLDSYPGHVHILARNKSCKQYLSISAAIYNKLTPFPHIKKIETKMKQRRFHTVLTTLTYKNSNLKAHNARRHSNIPEI